MLAIPEPQGEAARLHDWAITSPGPYWSSVLPPPKRGMQILPLVVLNVHYARCLEETTPVPRGYQPPPVCDDPTSLRHSL